ncbi:MAG: bifunctional ornithine acetyltransferase/N-acetylglutamate synthase, partial [Hydrogenovibrio crunogenus]|nr:bifunctional ornithine acetyltransferase/N-acetylglutamate synthase [Hydrogenovibrio crunogenus]
MAPTSNIHPVSGVYLGTTQAKIKKSGTEDFVIISFVEGSRTAATATTNAFCAA